MSVADRNPLRRMADVVEHVVDPVFGIVERVVEMPIQPGEPPFFHFYSNASNTTAFGMPANFNNAGGAASTRETALAKAVGEAVERYSAAFFDKDELPLRSVSDADFATVRPEEFALWSPAQYDDPGFMWAPWYDDTPVRWTPALEVLTGEQVHVPTAMVSIPYYFERASGEAPIVQPISTGLACHVSLPEAALGGLCETIERDALTIFWQAMMSPPQILPETLSEANWDRVRRFEETGASVTMLDLTMDHGILTVMSILRSPSPDCPALTFAAATSMDAEEACRKSLEELAHTRRFCQSIVSHMDRLEPTPDHRNVVDQLSHLNFWCDHRNAGLAEFAFASTARVEFDELASPGVGDAGRDLESACERISQVGHRVLLCDVTSPDVRSLGFRVVRAVVPGFHPLFMGYSNRALGGKRLWEVPQALGHPGITPGTGDNPSPHMYP